MGATGRPMHRGPWNKGNLVGQKAPFKLKDLWALRVRLQMEGRVRELALFSLGIDSRLRGCDLGALRVRDVCHGDQLATRAVVMQHETQQPVQLEITQATREVLQAWINQAGLKSEDCLFPRRLHDSPLLGTREYARILGHSKLEWTVRRLGIAVDDALESPNRWKSEALDGGRAGVRSGRPPRAAAIWCQGESSVSARSRWWRCSASGHRVSSGMSSEKAHARG